jgi:hypothetical protein
MSRLRVTQCSAAWGAHHSETSDDALHAFVLASKAKSVQVQGGPHCSFGQLRQQLGVAVEVVFLMIEYQVRAVRSAQEARAHLVANLEALAAKGGQENLVAGLDAHGHRLALVVSPSGSNGEDLALGRRLGVGGRDEDATGGFLGRWSSATGAATSKKDERTSAGLIL